MAWAFRGRLVADSWGGFAGAQHRFFVMLMNLQFR